MVFDPKIVADRSTYAAPREPSVGMKYVIVGGTVLIDQGKLDCQHIPREAFG